VTVRVDRKEGIAQLVCKICDQRFQSKVNRVYTLWLSNVVDLMQCGLFVPDLTEAVDIYSMWVDAADEAEKEQVSTRPRPAASGRRPEYSAAAVSDDEDD
jgi:transcription elongation factor Elf1